MIPKGSSRKKHGAEADDAPARDLFRHEVRRDGRVVATLSGSEVSGGVTVATEVHPVTGLAGQDPLLRPYAFSTPEHAHRFAEEALTALEYLGCTVA